MNRLVTSTFKHRELHELLAEADRGIGRFALVTGAVSSGKTTLLGDFAAHARMEGAAVLRASCTRFGRSDLLGVPRQLLGPTVGRREDTDEIGASVSTILRLSTDRAVVVCVDDVRHADSASARFLHRLAAEGAHHRVLVVATDRTRTPHTSSPAAEHLSRSFDVHRIVLAPLSTSDIVALAARDFRMGLCDTAVETVHDLTNGNPLLVWAALRDHTARWVQDRPVIGGEEPMAGPTYRQAFLDSLYRLDSEAREVAEMTAIVGPFGTTGIIAELTDTDPCAVEDYRDELTSSGLLHHSGFRHPAAQEAVLHDMSRARRVALCRRAAVVLGMSGAPAEDVALWLSAVEEVDAKVIRETSAPHATIPPARMAARQGRPRPSKSWELSDDVHTLWDATDLVARLDKDVAGLRYADSAEGAELKAGQLLVSCEFPGLLMRGPGEQVIGSPPVAWLAKSARYGAAWSLIRVLTGGVTQWDDVAIAERSLRSLALRPENMSAVLAGLAALVRSREQARARNACDRFLVEATEQSATTWQAQLLGVQAEISARAGDAAAIGEAEAALDLLPARHWGPRLGSLLAPLLLAHTETGNAAGAAVHLRHHLSEATFDTRHGLDYLYARGHHHLAAGQHLLALADFLRCGRRMINWGVDRDDLLPWRLAVAATYVAMGDYGKALAHIGEVVDRFVLTRGAADTRTVAREAIFETLRDTAGTPELLTAMRALECDEPLVGAKHAATPRYKISDRFSSCLDLLSLSERRVALLAANGATNQQIAHDLSITVSTVEQHLTRTYRKLQLAGRRDLRAKLG